MQPVQVTNSRPSFMAKFGYSSNIVHLFKHLSNLSGASIYILGISELGNYFHPFTAKDETIELPIFIG